LGRTPTTAAATSIAIALVCQLALSACVPPVGNAAQRATKPFLAALDPINPKLICEYGDSGRGLDNDIPWYQAYVYVDARSDVDDVVRAAARAAGYPVEIDQPAIDAYPYLQPDGTESGGAGPGFEDIVAGVPFDPASTYLISRRGASKLNVDVVRAGQVRLNCLLGGKVDAYGQIRALKPGQALVVVSMTLPSTRPAPRHVTPSLTGDSAVAGGGE
jgi:hypothetical protein